MVTKLLHHPTFVSWSSLFQQKVKVTHKVKGKHAIRFFHGCSRALLLNNKVNCVPSPGEILDTRESSSLGVITSLLHVVLLCTFTSLKATYETCLFAAGIASNIYGGD